MGTGHCSPSNDQDYAWRVPCSTREHESTRLNYGVVEWSDEVLARKPE